MLNISLNDFLKLRDVRFVNVEEKKFEIKHIKGISIDSRTIEPDQLFWAIKGERFDGHDFVKEAHAKSAFCCIVSEKYYRKFKDVQIPLVVVPDTFNALHEFAHNHRNKHKIPVIGLTGSNGKTTTKEMIAHILQTKINVHKTKGNLNNQIGCPLTLLQLTDIHEAAIIEMGSNQFGEIGKLTEIVQPNHALVTVIADTHLQFLKSREGVAKEKISLFDKLAEKSFIYKNLDDPFIMDYERKGLKYVTYSFEKKADITGKYGEIDENGCGTLILNNKTYIPLKTPGLHNVRNALAASSVALNLGYSEDEIAGSLQTYQGYEKRMQIIKWNDVKILNDTYNANPTSMELAIDSVIKIKHTGRIILALGNMNELGKSSIRMHKEVLEYALDKNVDFILVVGEYMHEACEKLSKSQIEKVIKCHDINECAGKLANILKSGDVMLLKGSRGMQMEKILAYLP